MSLNELIVEDAALECFGEQCRGAPTLIPAFSQGERRKSEGIRRLSSAIFFRTLADLCEGLLTVAAYLLTSNGSGPVCPLALASTANSDE